MRKTYRQMGWKDWRWRLDDFYFTCGRDHALLGVWNDIVREALDVK